MTERPDVPDIPVTAPDAPHETDTPELALTEQIAGVATSHALFELSVADLDEEAVRRPSRLPGWTLAHVLAHVAKNADSVVRRYDAALRNGLAPQYPGGGAGRAAEIEECAAARVAELLADLRRADAEVDQRFADAPAELWERKVLAGERTIPVSRLVLSRWREVEIHHVDLDLGYEPTHWPEPMVRIWLPRLMDSLQDRADPRELAAWITRRGPAPELPSWG